MKEKFHNENTRIVEKVVLVGVLIKGQDEVKLTEYIDELAFLAETAGA